MSTTTSTQSQPNIAPSWMEKDTAKRYLNAENATRPFAAIMVENAKLAQLTGPVKIFDLASGTGAVEQEIYNAVPTEKWGDLSILSGDTSEPMLSFLKERSEKEGWTGVETRRVDGGDMQLPASTFTHIFVGFGIFVMPPSTTANLFKLLQPGGFLSVSSWAYMPWYGLLGRSLARMADPPRMPMPEEIILPLSKGLPWNDATFVRKQLEDAGCVDIDVVQLKRNVDCGTPTMFIETMAMIVKMVAMVWDEGKREQLIEEVSKAMLEQVTEEAGGEEGRVFMEFEPIIASGWKPE